MFSRMRTEFNVLLPVDQGWNQRHSTGIGLESRKWLLRDRNVDDIPSIQRDILGGPSQATGNCEIPRGHAPTVAKWQGMLRVLRFETGPQKFQERKQCEGAKSEGQLHCLIRLSLPNMINSNPIDQFLQETVTKFGCDHAPVTADRKKQIASQGCRLGTLRNQCQIRGTNRQFPVSFARPEAKAARSCLNDYRSSIPSPPTAGRNRLPVRPYRLFLLLMGVADLSHSLNGAIASCI
jgi:hypothetical protein